MLVKQLTAKIGADIKDFDKAMKGMSAKFKQHGEKFKKVGKGMTIAGAAIIGTVGLMMKKYGEAGDAVHKMALRTGFSTETLSELKYAAEISGTSLGSLEKGVKKMATSIGDARLGLKTYTDAFALVGIEVKELDGLNPEEQFMKIAMGIAAIEDPTDRANAAMKLLGSRAGTELLPLFAEGVDGIEALCQKARDLGYSFDQEAAAGAARLVDAQTSLKTSVAGLGISISQTLSPHISKLTENLADTIGKVSEWIKEHPKLTEIIAKAVLGLGAFLTVMGPIMMMLPGIVLILPKIAIGIKMLLGPIGLVIAAAGVAYKVISDLTKAKEKMIEADYQAFEAEHKLGQKLREISDAAGLTRKEFIELTRKYEGNTNALAIAILKGKEGVKLQKAMKTIGKERVKQQKELNKKIDDGSSFLDEYNKAIANVKDATEEVTEATETWKDYLQTLGVKTIPEKEKRVKLLKSHLEKLHKEYKDGKLDLEDYEKAIKAAKDEMKGLSTTITTTAMPAARDMSGVLDKAVGEMESRIPDVTTAIETEVTNISTTWDNLTTNMGNAFGNFTTSILTKGSDLGDALAGLWNDILNSFRSMTSNMVSEWATGFLKKIISKTEEAAPDITAATSSAGTKAGKGFSEAMAGIAIFTLPLLMIPLAGWLDSMFESVYKKSRELYLKVAADWQAATDTVEKMAEELGVPWQKLKGYLGGKEEEEAGEGGWQTGFEGIVTKPIRPLIGEVPEYVKVTPLSKMAAIGPGATSGGQTFITNVTLNITAMDAIGVREFMRNRGLPEIVEAVKVNYKQSKSNLKRVLEG